MDKLNKIEWILKFLYDEVYLLKDWIIMISEKSGLPLPNLMQSGDPSNYIQLIQTTKVCCQKFNHHRLSNNCFSPTQNSHQREIIMRVIERILKKDKKSCNVLTQGFTLQSQNENTCISTTSNIELSYPNSGCNRLQYSSWKLLLSRIGDSVMEYLLETTSVFLQIGETCFIQVTGDSASEIIWRVKLKSMPKLKTDKNSKQINKIYFRKKKYLSNTKAFTNGHRSKICVSSNVVRSPAYEFSHNLQVLSKRKRKVGDFESDVKRRKIVKCDVNNGESSKSGQEKATVSVKDIHHTDKKLDNTTHYKNIFNKNMYEGKGNPSETTETTADACPSTFTGSANMKGKESKPFDFHQCLRRNNLFYGKNLKEKIPKLGSVEEMLKEILETQVGGVTRTEINLYSLLRKILQELLDNYKKFPWMPMLNFHCPWQRKRNSAKDRYMLCRKTTQPTTASLLENYSTHDQVFLLLKAATKRILPIELFGCSENRNIFLKNIKRFIGAGKFDRICLGEIMYGIKVKRCHWLKEISSPTQQSHVMAKLQLWLLNRLIVPIIQGFFYVTDSSNYRNRIFYYRKSLWQKVFFSSLKDFKRKSCLKTIPESEVKMLLKTGRSLGIAHLRFLPKTSSCRPIVNMGRNLNIPGISKTIPINKQLINLHTVLSDFKEREEERLGASTFGPDDIYFKLKQYKRNRELNKDSRDLYFVKTDITSCYDTIKQDKLYAVIKDLFERRNEDYISRRYHTVMTVGGKIRGLIKRDSQPIGNYDPDFFSFIEQKIKTSQMRNLIIIDKVVSDHISTDNLLQHLHDLLFNNIIKIGRIYYKQEIGIGQGSIISSLLCNFYYGEMERERVKVLGDELMMRMVDDSLFITPYKHRAVDFLTAMWKGNEDYNCHVNAGKMVTNFTYQIDDSDIEQLTNQDFSWCGYLINTSTLNVTVDYARYIGLAITDTMSYEMGQNAGEAMKSKLMLSLGPKCHGLFMDCKLNDSQTVERNVYQLFHLLALKYQSYHSKLPHKQRSSTNTQFFADLILDLANFTYQQSKYKLTKLNKDFKEEWFLPFTVVKWLCLNSFIKTLSRFQSQFHELLKCLQSCLKRSEKQLGKEKVEELKRNIDQHCSTILQNMML